MDLLLSETVALQATRGSKIKGLYDNLSRLEEIIDGHGGRLFNRWVNKSAPKRKSVLRDAWPGIPEVRHPDFRAWRIGRAAHTRQALLWPTINIKDLSNSTNLLVFLQSRIQHRPADFATSDFDATRFGQTNKMIKLPGVSCQLARFHTTDTPEGYLEIAEVGEGGWKSLRLSGYLTNREFELILEIQESLYGFLVNVCQAILHDMDTLPSEAPMGKVTFMRLVSGAHNPGNLAILTYMRSTAQYILPATLDLQLVHNLVQGSLDSAKEHLMLLKEDPAYYEATVQDFYDHRPENLKDDQGRVHPRARDRKNALMWRSAVFDALVCAITKVEQWNAVYEAVVKQIELERKYRGRIASGERWPEEYEEMFGVLSLHLEDFTCSVLTSLKLGLPPSPPFRAHYTYKSGRLRDLVWEMREKGSLRKDSTRSELISLFDYLFSRKRQGLIGIPIILEEIECMMSNDTAARRLISGWIANHLSDLMVLVECAQKLYLSEPWATRFSKKKNRKGPNVRETVKTPARNFQRLNSKAIMAPMTSLGAVCDNRFTYPKDKHGPAKARACIAAEKRLKELWAAIENALADSTIISPVVKEVLAEAKPLNTTIPDSEAPTRPPDTRKKPG